MNDADVSRYEAERRQLREDNKRMWEDLVRLRKWKENAEEENVKLWAERDQVEGDMSSLRKDARRAKKESLDHQMEALRIQARMIQAEYDIETVQETVEQLQQENGMLRTSSTRFQAELQDLQESHSEVQFQNAALMKRFNVRFCTCSFTASDDEPYFKCRAR